MSIALRNKRFMALMIVLAVLTLLAITFVLFSTVGHIDMWRSIGAVFPRG